MSGEIILAVILLRAVADARRLVLQECQNNITFRRIRITDDADGANSVHASDLDNDGDVDVLSASSYDDTIAWYENDGASPPSFTKYNISTGADGAQSVYVTDLDGDGDADVLTASLNDNTIAWYANDGRSPPTFTRYILSTLAGGASSVFAADLDGDGDLDVLSSSKSDNTISWYESDGGSPPSFDRHVITTGAYEAHSVHAADLDNDGLFDVISSSSVEHSIGWYENDGGIPLDFTQRGISTSADSTSLYTADLDSDGDIDVLSASDYDNTVAWFENKRGSFERHDITTSAFGAHSVYVADLDNDGDLDILSALYDENTIEWYQSDGKSPPNFVRYFISTTAVGARSVFAADLDDDGDMDVISASSADDSIEWYVNDCVMTTPITPEVPRPTPESTMQPTQDPVGTPTTLPPTPKPTASPMPGPPEPTETQSTLQPRPKPTTSSVPSGTQPTLQPRPKSTGSPRPTESQPTLRPIPKPTLQPIQQGIVSATPTWKIPEPTFVDDKSDDVSRIDVNKKTKKKDNDFVTDLVVGLICTIAGTIITAIIAACCDSCLPEFDRRLPPWFHYWALGYWINCCSCENCCSCNVNVYFKEHHPLHGASLAAFGNVESVDKNLFVKSVTENAAFIYQLRHHGLNTGENGGNLGPALRKMFESIVRDAPPLHPPRFNQAQWREWLKSTYDPNFKIETGGKDRDETLVTTQGRDDVTLAAAFQTSVVDL